MNKIIGLFIVVLISCFCDGNAKVLEEGYDITIQINNIKDTVAYLGYNFGDQKFVKDTSQVFDDGVLRFNGSEDLTEGIYFIYTPSIYFELIANERAFTIETDTLDFIRNMRIKNSPENDVFNQFQRFMADKQKESLVFTNKLNSLNPQNDSSEIRQVREQVLAIRDEIEKFQIDLAQEHKGLFVAQLLMAMQKPKVPGNPSDDGQVVDKNFQFFYYKEHFFDNFDLSSSGLLRTPLYQPKIDEYLDKLTFQHPDSIKKAADYLLSLSESNQETFRYIMVKLTTKYETSKVMGMEEVFVYLAENYYLTGKAFWADEDLVEKFRNRVNELKPNLIGAIAPDMILLDTLMRKVQLSQLESRFIVLYFYDPDCGHCKKTTPVLYELYKKIKGKGVEVMAACTVTDIEKWKKYVRTNKLDWVNVSDPYYKSNFRAEYDIKTTPVIYILNNEKEIIAKRLGVEQIEDFIDRMIEFEEG